MFRDGDASRIDLSLDSRAATFENPGGERGAGGKAYGGRKGAPSRVIAPGERVTLSDLHGPGTIRHIWMTIPPAPPEIMRAMRFEAFYDGRAYASIAVPCLDFFGAPHGRPVSYHSALTAIHEGRGFNAYFPIPFRESLRLDFINDSQERTILYYQVDFTLQPELPSDTGLLHVSFRRENPTVLREDFTIASELPGPGRFLGAVMGVRTIDACDWYGEGEVKVYRDGDTAWPTICGTGLEDYVGSAWGMGPHAALYAGAPLEVRQERHQPPDFIGFYRWHLPDPIVYERDLRVTIQQIGAVTFLSGQEDEFARYRVSNPAAGAGWTSNEARGVIGRGIAERVDDYSAAAFVYCAEPHPVPPFETAAAVADLERRDYERPHPFERPRPGAPRGE